MANLGQKNGIYHIRFRFHGKEYKKSLKTNDADSAAAAKSSVELTIHRLITGLIVLPTGIDPGDFILSGGTLQQHRKAPKKRNLPSTNQLICEYLESQKKFLADSSHSTLAMHLRHLTRRLGDRADASCDRVTHRDLDSFQQTRLAERDAVTVDKERVSIRQFYKWAVAQGYLSASPAAMLPAVKGSEDRPPFRTLAEIDRIIARSGLTKEEILDHLGVPLSEHSRNRGSAGDHSRHCKRGLYLPVARSTCLHWHAARRGTASSMVGYRFRGGLPCRKKPQTVAAQDRSGPPN